MTPHDPTADACVAVVGGMNLDIHGKPAVELGLGDSNPGVVRSAPGGVGRNIAENLARLGIKCQLFSVVGADPPGELLLQQTRAAGVDVQNVVQLDDARTSTYLSLLDHQGDLHAAVADTAIMERLTPERLRSHEPQLCKASLIVVDTNLNDDTLTWIAESCAARPLFVDPVSAAKAIRLRPLLGSIHTLKASLAEAEAIAGFSTSSDDQWPRLAAWFHAQGVQRLFVTLGQHGVFYSTLEGQGWRSLPNDGVTISNTAGAGDAFLAGLACSWLNGWGLEQSVEFALAAASVTLSYDGTNHPGMSLATVTRQAEKFRV